MTCGSRRFGVRAEVYRFTACPRVRARAARTDHAAHSTVVGPLDSTAPTRPSMS